MIAGVRQFKLINGNGTEYDMTRPDALLHAPDGLGWGTEATVNRLGMTYIGINEKEIHQSPSGEMVFRTYEEYGRFLSFCQQGGLVLCYKPIDTWYYCECLISIQKSEIQWKNNHLICPVQFTLLSYWYEKVVAQTAEPPEPVEPSYATVTGDPAVFTARYSYPIKDLSVAIQGSQDLNGYDKPWVGGAGKNLSPQDSATTTRSGNLSLTQNGKFGENYEAGVTYTVSFETVETNSANVRLRFNNANVHQWSSGVLVAGNRHTWTFTPAEDGYINLWSASGAFSGDTTAIINFMVEKGSTATAYEPYENICPITSYTSVNITQTGSQTNTYEVELTGAGNVYKGTLDVTSGELVVTESVINVMSSWTWFKSSSYPGSFFAYMSNYVGSKWKPNARVVCNVLPWVVIGASTYKAGYCSTDNAFTMWFPFFNSSTTVQEFKAYLATLEEQDNGVQIAYTLNTPLTYQLTPTQMSNLIGQNTIQADAGAVTVTYRTDARTEYKIYPYQYSYKYGDTAQNVFDISCDLPSYFKLTIFGERTNPSWRVVQNGNIVKSGKLNATIGSSQKLVINTDPKNTEIALYTLSNTRINNLYGYSDFATERIFALPQGECQVQVLTEDEQPPKVMIEVLKHV